MSHGGFRASCSCGRVDYEIDEAGVQKGTRLICYCRSCRVADVYLRGDQSGLTADKGVELFQATPDHLQINQGVEHLAAMRLNAKGPMRWYASCCGTPLWNTLSTPKIPFWSFVISPEDQSPQAPELGACKSVNTKFAQAGSGAPSKSDPIFPIILSLLGRMPKALRNADQNPLLNANRQFIVEFQLLDEAQRKEAYAKG